MSATTEMYDPGLPKWIQQNPIFEGRKLYARAPAAKVLQALEHVRTFAQQQDPLDIETAFESAIPLVGWEAAEVAEAVVQFILKPRYVDRVSGVLRELKWEALNPLLGRAIFQARAVVAS